MRSEKTAIFRVMAAVAIPFMQLLGRYPVTGSENVPKTGAFILAPNHYSNIDPLVVGLVMYRLGRMPRFLAKASLFRVPIVGWLLTRSGQIPVERSSHSRTTDPLASAAHITERGYAVIIYPEGSLTRDPDYWPMRGKFGAVRAALEHGIPLVPVAHWGAQKIMPRYTNRMSVFPRKTVQVRFGTPIDLSPFTGKPLDTALLQQATLVLMNSLTEILEELRDETAPAERWDPAAHNQTEIGRIESA